MNRPTLAIALLCLSTAGCFVQPMQAHHSRHGRPEATSTRVKTGAEGWTCNTQSTLGDPCPIGYACVAKEGQVFGRCVAR